MHNQVYQSTLGKAINTLLLFLTLIWLMSCSEQKSGETAKSGKMTLAVDRHLGETATLQLESFSRYYPDARITLMPSPSGTTLKHLLNQNARAALITGEPETAEDSLFAALHPPLRREPVARDAIVCIVNRFNPVTKLSLNELKTLFSGKEIVGATPLLVADDYRLQSVFAASIGISKKDIHARGSINETELVKRIATDTKAIGLLFRSSLNGALDEGTIDKQIRIIPLSKNSDASRSFLPTQQNIFEGRYPLVTTVYYLYYSGDALAAGFGSWLTSSGQKAFEKSSLAPYRSFERTIILK